MSIDARERVRAPGRVNLIGDHTDYTGGLVLPAAIDRFVEIDGELGGREVVLSWTSSRRSPPSRSMWQWRKSPGSSLLGVGSSPLSWPSCGRHRLRRHRGLHRAGGAGLASSAALELALAVALGAPEEDRSLARMAQRAEHAPRGVPTGIMDQLACVAGRNGHAILIDCATLAITAVPLPPDVGLVVFHSGQARDLASSAYAERVGECAAAEAEIGPLRTATLADVDQLADPLLRHRAGTSSRRTPVCVPPSKHWGATMAPPSVA